MSIYRKDETGVVKKVATPIIQRWNDRIFTTTRSAELVNGVMSTVYDIDPSANKYISGLSNYTEFQLYFGQANNYSTVYVRFNNKMLLLKRSYAASQPIAINTLRYRTTCYTLDTSSNEIWTDYSTDMTLVNNDIIQLKAKTSTLTQNPNITVGSNVYSRTSIQDEQIRLTSSDDIILESTNDSIHILADKNGVDVVSKWVNISASQYPTPEDTSNIKVWINSDGIIDIDADDALYMYSDTYAYLGTRGSIEIDADTEVLIKSGTNTHIKAIQEVIVESPVFTLLGGAAYTEASNGVITNWHLESHDENNMSHPDIRNQLTEITRDIQRLDGRGKSFGEIDDQTTADLQAMTPAERAATIKAHIEAQDWFEGTYTPQLGDLIYDAGTEAYTGVGYHEWEYNGTAWVDNGLIGYSQATNTVYGMVKGDNNYVSITNGNIIVLKSDTTNKIVGNYNEAYGELTYPLLKAFQDSIPTNYYNKTETYTKNEVYNKNETYNKEYIDALKDKNGWESELLGTLSNNGTIALSVINQYDEIQMYAKDTLGVIDNENIRPSLMQSGDSVYFFDDTQAFIMVDTVFGFYAPVGYTLQVVGIKYTELKASDVATSEVGVTVQDKLDEIDLGLEQKTDKLESRQVGETVITYQSGVIVSMSSDNVVEAIEYDVNGVVEKVTSTYADGKVYEETYTKDVNGNVTKIMKVEVI